MLLFPWNLMWSYLSSDQLKSPPDKKSPGLAMLSFFHNFLYAKKSKIFCFRDVDDQRTPNLIG